MSAKRQSLAELAAENAQLAAENAELMAERADLRGRLKRLQAWILRLSLQLVQNRINGRLGGRPRLIPDDIDLQFERLRKAVGCTAEDAITRLCAKYPRSDGTAQTRKYMSDRIAQHSRRRSGHNR
jgi:hypothetical protein